VALPSQQRPRGIHGQTVETIAGRILSNEYPEGATLDLPSLRAELEVSLTALREALKVLNAKGMIDARQKRGTFVQPRSSWHMLDADVMRWHTSAVHDPGLFDQLTEVRAVVEPAAARLAAERATETDLAELETALTAMADARDVSAAVAADVTFHRRLLLATHNEFLAQMAQIIAIGLAKRDEFVHHANPSDPVPSHRAVLDAVTAHDPVAAERTMRALVDKSLTDLKNAGR
jgi:DNA-binding FadR family transcriptional regulator